eukprot:COSAG06_NODE_4781_length_3959_cov_92.982997_3_plen_46_part_00
MRGAHPAGESVSRFELVSVGRGHWVGVNCITACAVVGENAILYDM